MKKIVLKLVLDDDKAKQKALKTVSTLSGIDFISVEMKEQKMTVIGTVDPVNVVSKLRKHWQTDIISVGPAKVPEKKEEVEEPKKEEPKKEEEKKKEEEPKKEEKKEEPKEEPKKEESKKEQEPKKEEEPKMEEEKKKQPDPVLELVRAYRAYNPHMTTYYYVQSMEDDPNGCVIS